MKLKTTSETFENYKNSNFTQKDLFEHPLKGENFLWHNLCPVPALQMSDVHPAHLLFSRGKD